MEKSIRVIVADDHYSTLKGSAALIEDHPELTVVASTTDPDICVRKCAELKPNVAVVDLCFQGRCRADLCRAIKLASPRTAVGIQSMFTEWGHLKDSFDAGADGYIGKLDFELSLAEFTLRLARGELVLDSKLDQNVAALRNGCKRDTLLTILREWKVQAEIANARSQLKALTNTQMKVLRAYSAMDGRFTIGSLGEKLGFKTEQQVHTHLSNIRKLLGVERSKDAMAVYLRAHSKSTTPNPDISPPETAPVDGEKDPDGI